MKLPTNADAFMGFRLDEPFESRLPSPELIQAGTVDEYFAQLVATDFVYRQVQNFTQIARYSVGWTAVNEGIAADFMPKLREMFDAAQRITPGNVAKLIATGAELIGGLANFADALDGVTRVPVLGLVVKVGLFIYNWVKMIVRAAKEKKIVYTAPGALTYKRALDSELVDGIITEGKGGDWTRIFQPPQLGVWEEKKIAYTRTGYPDGISFGPTGPNLGRGIPPLITSRFGDYQYPKKVPGSERPSGVEMLVGGSELFPATAQAGLLYSQRIMKPSPQMFDINAVEIISAWEEYFGEGRELAARMDPSKSGHEGTAQLRSQALAATSFAHEPFGINRFSLYTPQNVPSFVAKDPVDGWLSLAPLVKWIVMEKWRRSAIAALGTTLVAYVSPNAPAFRDDPMLAAAHDSYRRLLLDHKRRFDVELDLIPDEPYRQAMWNATMKLDPRWQLRTDPKPRELPTFAGFVVIDPDEPKPPPEGDAEPAIPAGADVPPEGGGSIIVPALVVGAVAGALWWARK